MKLASTALAAIVAAGGAWLALTVTGQSASLTPAAASVTGWLKGYETLGWSGVPDVTGYALYRDGVQVSTAGPHALSARFYVQSGQHTLEVWAIFGTAPTTTTPPTTTVTSPTVAPPVAPITTVTNATFGAHIYQAPATLSDYVIDGTSDSAVLVEPAGKGSTLRRFHITRAASVGSGPGWARHGVYAKAENITLEDFYIRADPGAPNVGQCLSVRDAGFTADRFDCAGAPLVVAVFEDSPTVGQILFQDGTGSGTDTSSAVWIDTTLPQTVTFRRCHFTGQGLFLAASSAYTGTVVIDGSTWNGQPVTAAMVRLPAAKLTIL